MSCFDLIGSDLTFKSRERMMVQLPFQIRNEILFFLV